MKRWIWFVGWMCSFSAIGQCDAIETLYNDGAFEEVIERINEPQTPCEWLLLADSHHKLGAFEDALQAYDEVIDGSQDPSVLLHRGICLFSLAQYERSKDDLAMAYEEGLRDKRIPYYLAACDYMEGNYNRAIAYLKDALEIDPDYFDAHYLLGAAYLENGKPTSAQGAFEKCGALKPEDDRTQLNLAITLLDQFRFDDARTILDVLARSEDDSMARDAYYQRGCLRFQTHDRAGACEDWANAAELGDQDAIRLQDTICEGKKKKLVNRKKVYVSF